jgi:hypothetical protein
LSACYDLGQNEEMKRCFYLFNCLFLLALALNSQAQIENTLNPTESDKFLFNLEKDKNDLLAMLSVLPQQDVILMHEKILQIKENFDRYIEHKRLECTGEFTQFIKNDLGEMESVKRVLTREERKLCIVQLRDFHQFYLEKLLEAKKNYLNRLHAKHMVELEMLKNDISNQLDRTYKDVERVNTKLKTQKTETKI